MATENDDDVPGIRLWGDSRLADAARRGDPVVHPQTDVPTDLSKIATDLARVRLPSESSPPPKSSAPARIVLEIFTTDGAVLSDVEVEMTSSGQRVRTDATGRASFQVPDEGIYWFRFSQVPLALPQPKPGAVGAGGQALRVERGRTDPFGLSTSPYDRQVAVRRPCCTEVLVDGYAEGSSVMRWGGTRWRTTAEGPVLGTMRAALRVALTAARGDAVVCVGHTDPEGSEAANDSLALERARSIALFLQGDKDGWAEHAAAHATELDEQCALVAVSKILGEAVAFDDDDGLARTHQALLQWAGLSEDGSVVEAVQEWRAIAELYETDLASFMRCDQADLEALRKSIRWYESTSCGERWPRDLAAELDAEIGPGQTLAQRRVGILIMDPCDDPQRVVEIPDEAYDGTYSRKPIETPAEGFFELQLRDPKGRPLPAGRAWLTNDFGVAPAVANAAGVIAFAVLVGERVVVVQATDAQRGGHVVDGGLST